MVILPGIRVIVRGFLCIVRGFLRHLSKKFYVHVLAQCAVQCSAGTKPGPMSFGTHSFDVYNCIYFLITITVFIRLIAARIIRKRLKKSVCASLFGCVYY